MKKLIFIIATFAVVQSSFGQLNPINNLEWDHWYVTPNNYFVLSWDNPDPSQDTLVGYNIYRNAELYRFQIDDNLYHTEAGANCGEDFLVFNGDDFWIHVTAIYNSTLLESDYVDSAYVVGHLIGVNDITHPKLKFFPNPTSGKLKIDSESDIEKIIIISSSGEIIDEYKKSKYLDLSNLPRGVYFLTVWTDKNVFSKPIILE